MCVLEYVLEYVCTYTVTGKIGGSHGVHISVWTPGPCEPINSRSQRLWVATDRNLRKQEVGRRRLIWTGSACQTHCFCSEPAKRPYRGLSGILYGESAAVQYPLCSVFVVHVQPSSMRSTCTAVPYPLRPECAVHVQPSSTQRRPVQLNDAGGRLPFKRRSGRVARLMLCRDTMDVPGDHGQI